MHQLLTNLAGRIFQSSGDDTEGGFLFERISVLVLQRFKGVLIHDKLLASDCKNW